MYQSLKRQFLISNNLVGSNAKSQNNSKLKQQRNENLHLSHPPGKQLHLSLGLFVCRQDYSKFINKFYKPFQKLAFRTIYGNENRPRNFSNEYLCNKMPPAVNVKLSTSVI